MLFSRAGYRTFAVLAPRSRRRTLPAVLGAMLAGVLLRLAAHLLDGPQDVAIGLGLFGAGLEQLAVVLFIIQMVFTFARGRSRFDAATAFIFAELLWALAMAEFNAWYTWATLAAADRGEVIHIVSTYQPALRSLQLRGFGLFIILGVCLPVLRGLFGLPAVGERRAWAAFAVLLAAVLLDAVSFVLMRRTGDHRFGCSAGWLLLPVGCCWSPCRKPGGRSSHRRTSSSVSPSPGSPCR